MSVLQLETTIPHIYSINPSDDEWLRLHFHPGQLRAWDSEKRFIAVLAGTQGG